MIYDGNGGEPYTGDIGINGDSIAFIGDPSKARVTGSGCCQQGHSAGFINMLSWANQSPIADSRSAEDIRQGDPGGDGEGESIAALNARWLVSAKNGQRDNQCQ